MSSQLHRKKRTRDHDHSIAQAQRARDKHEHGVAKQSRAHEHSAAAAAAAPSGTRATLASSSTRTPVVAVALLLRTARAQNSNSTVRCCCSCSKNEQNKIFAAKKNTTIRVDFQAPGWLFGSGTPSPELLAGSSDFDHLENGPQRPAGANACTVLSTPPCCGPRSRKHEKRPAAKRKK